MINIKLSKVFWNVLVNDKIIVYQKTYFQNLNEKNHTNGSLNIKNIY